MALFGKSESFVDLVKRLQSVADSGGPELEDLITRVVTHEQAQPRKLVWMLTARQALVREHGRCMVVQTGADGVDLLMEAIGRAEAQDVRRELAREVLQCDSKDVQRVISRYVHSKRKEHRAVALEIAAADREWMNWVGVLKRGLKDPEPSLRLAAVRTLCRGLETENIQLILRPLLHDDDEALRAEVIQAFCDRPTPDIVEPFFARLPLESARTRDLMINALGRLVRDPSVNLGSYLVPVLADEEVEVRNTAVKLLAQLPDPTEVMRLVLLRSRGLAPWLRERATEALLSRANLLVQPTIALMADPNLDVQVGAMTLASRINDPTIVPAVRQIFVGNADWWIRSMAAGILVRFPTPDLIDVLVSQFGDEELRYGIVSALGELKDPQAQECLLETLQSPKPSMRSATLRCLAGFQNEQVAQSIARVAIEDPAPQVRERALDVLRGWGAQAKPVVDAIERQRESAIAERQDQQTLTLAMANDDLNAAKPGSMAPPSCM